ncbi:MAG: hypothetical protein QF741_03855 [Candidatus Peribacteraceae bacterium]|jgi:hypothetical protein|nr:hypothetical protein [Candidatus Peribacteraceae bacterium]MDP7454377.1 hypothetical protein [Candidatus Peribacteraceae bacterium]MDP7646181.1 hypothetical protein [Candidatus Peribacteraceae bacterium]
MPAEHSSSGDEPVKGPDDGLDELADALVEKIMPGSGQAANGGTSAFINYETDATVEPLTVDHLRMKSGGVKDCYEASMVPIDVIIDMAKAACEQVEQEAPTTLIAENYNWPFGRSGGMLNPFDAIPRSWILSKNPPISIEAMMEEELKRAAQLKTAGSPQKHKRAGWLGKDDGRYGNDDLYDSVYEGEVLMMEGKVVAWFTWWRSQFKDALDERRNADEDWSVADVHAMFDKRYKDSESKKYVRLNDGENVDNYQKAAPRILRTDTANALPGYPGAAGYILDKSILRLMEEYGYDMAHAWRIANMEVFQEKADIGKRISSFGENDLSESLLRKRKFDPKGTRLSDGLAVYNVQVDSDSSPKEVQVLAREEHLIGVKECMVSKMKANLARYKPTSD